MSIKKQIWVLAWPVMMVSTLNTLFSIIDLKFVAMLGTNETAGAVVATSLIGVILVLPSLISSGTIAIASRNVGSGNESEFTGVSEQSITYSFIFGIITYVLCVIFKRSLLGIFGVTPEVYVHAVNFTDIIYLMIPVNFVLTVLVSILHAKGDTRTPMKAFAAVNAINIVLDWLFMIVLGFGIKGAAAATVIGQVYGLVYLFIKVMKVLNIRLADYIRSITINREMLKRILKIGGYSVLYGITRPFTGMLMYKIAAESGTEAVAAFGIGGRLFSVLFIFLGGLEVAISIMVGQSLGGSDTGKIDKLIKEGIKVATLNIAILAVPFVIFAKYLMLAFTHDPIVVAMGVKYLRIVYAGLVTYSYLTVYNAVFKGAGDTKPPMYAAIISNWPVKLLLAVWLSRTVLRSDGVWLAIAVSVFIESVIIWFYFRKGTWRHKKV